MPKASPIISSFVAGELSPRLTGRIDLSNYHQGCAILENMYVLPQGGVERRPGTCFVAEVKDSTKATRLIPFEFSSTQAYILEFGHQYIRFYANLGQIQLSSVAYEIASPYVEADLFGLVFCQSADTMYIAHANYAPRKLTRTGHTAWTLATINFLPPPTAVRAYYPNTTLTPGATTGSGVTFTAGTPFFLTGDKARMIVYGSARGVITAIGSPTPIATCTVNILDDFPNTDPIPAGSWSIINTPFGYITPSPSVPLFGICSIQAVEDMFRPDDIGRYIYVHSGIVQIITYSNSTLVHGYILEELAAVTQTLYWTMEDAIWSAALGYPGAVTFFEQRLVLSGSPYYPQTIVGSKTDDYENMSRGSNDDQSLQFTIAAREVNVVKWLEGSQVLLIGTMGGEWRMGASAYNTPLTPSNVSVRQQTKYGSCQVQPVTVGNVTFFLQRAGRKLRGMFYNFEEDIYLSPDFSKAAEHITAGGIVDMAWQQEPNAILWLVRADGVLVGFTYDQEAEVRAWHRHITDGQVESVAVIPGAEEEYELWMIVKREINGSDVRYIEYMKPMDFGTDQADCFFVDCGLSYDGSPTATLAGLDHLEGKTVDVLGDGAVFADQVVSSGQITLETTVSKAHVGLPYTSKLQIMPVEAGSSTGTAQGKIKRICQITVRLLNSLGFQIGADENHLDTALFREPGMAMDAPPPLFTGDKDIDYPEGWETMAQPMIVQAQPLPLHVLALIIRTMTTND